MGFKKWFENQMPSVLYHHSRPSQRQSILQHGLQTKFDQTVDLTQSGVTGGIYLSDKSNLTTRSDVWQVDVRGLPVEDDWTSTPEDSDENWYIVYQDIPPARIKLVSR